MPAVKTKRLGQILIESGQLTPEKLDLALSEQRQTGEKLGVVLQRLGICSEKQIARTLAGQAGVECVELIGLEIAPAALTLVERAYAEKRALLPLQVKASSLVVAMANPLDLATIDELTRMTGKYIEVVHAPDSEVADAIVRYYGVSGDGADAIPSLIEKAQRALASGVKLDAGDSPFIRLIDEIFQIGLREGATDVHLEPEEKVLRCRYRVDGHLVQGPILPRELQPIAVTRVKIMAELDISESRVPQDGRILLKSGRKKVDLRVSTFPTVHGEGIVCRVLDKENLIVGLERLGMDREVLQIFHRDIVRPHGIILVTGPTGSGKTTTLYSVLTYLNKPNTKIITLEDPVEYELPVINQAQINTAKGFTFAKGLRAILRQDPDILLVGEIRDAETAQLAIRAALTGHLVFSTLHTNSAVGAIPRLIDMGIEPFLLSATLVAVLAQRLMRTVCSECGEDWQPDTDALAAVGLEPADVAGATLRRGKGCPVCRGTGHRGRTGAFEYLGITPAIRRLIAGRADSEDILAAAREQGWRTLAGDGLRKLREGSTSLGEYARVVI